VWEIQARIALNCQKVRTQPKGSLLAEWRSRCGRTCCFVVMPNRATARAFAKSRGAASYSMGM
jgi:hypothetical protein